MFYDEVIKAISSGFAQFTWLDVLDIIIICVLLYKLIIWTKETRAYEVLKGLAHAGDSLIVRALRWPGLMLQHLTTREPDDAMLEVAIASMKAAKAGAAHYKEQLDPGVYAYSGSEEKESEADRGGADAQDEPQAEEAQA